MATKCSERRISRILQRKIPMKVTPTDIKDCYIIEPTIFEDERGYFFESFNEQKFQELTELDTRFVQDNQSQSQYGVIRGLHAQKEEFAQAKLVRVLEGEVIDVAVDIRPDSPTFGKKVAVHLTEGNKKQLFVPRGCLHGFSVLSEKATFFYKCDNFYCKEAEIGALYNDNTLNIDWRIPQGKEIISEKDKNQLSWEELVNQLKSE